MQCDVLPAECSREFPQLSDAVGCESEGAHFDLFCWQLSPTDKTMDFQKHFRIRHYAGDVT